MIRRLLVIEGVTGAGKSQLIEAMLARNLESAAATLVIDEEATLGTVLDDLHIEAWRASPLFPSFDRALERVRHAARTPEQVDVLVERFHLTPFARSGDWEAVRPYDEALSAFGAVQLLLDFPEPLIEQRSILRPDRVDEDWAAAMDAAYGGRAAAIAAVSKSQSGRRRGLLLSRLPYLHFDTAERDWLRYARMVDGYTRPAS